MNGKLKICLTVALICVGTATFAGPRGHHHRHHRNEGLALANGIVDLVLKVVAPQPVVVAPQPVVVAPRPVVIAPRPRFRPAPPPRRPHHHKKPGHRR